MKKTKQKPIRSLQSAIDFCNDHGMAVSIIIESPYTDSLWKRTLGHSAADDNKRLHPSLPGVAAGAVANMRYVMNMTVRSVEKKTQLVRAWKDEHGDTRTETEMRGWLVVFDPGGMSILLEEQPEWNAGQAVRITIEASK